MVGIDVRKCPRPMSTAPAKTRTYELPIGGAWSPAASGGTYDTLNPFTGEPWATVPEGGAEDVDRAVRAARDAPVGPVGPDERERARGACCCASRTCSSATRPSAGRDRDARQRQAAARDGAARPTALPEWYHYFGGLADKIDGDTIAADRPRLLRTTRATSRVGVVGAIMPWNSPLMLLDLEARARAGGRLHGRRQAVRAHPGLDARVRAAGSRRPGFPPGVVNVVTGYGAGGRARALVAHPGVAKIAFTGGDRPAGSHDHAGGGATT